MRCIILAGGKGTRLKPLTNSNPKPLLMIGSKTVLEHTLGALPENVTSVTIAVKHLGQKIKARIGKKFEKKSVTYVNLVTLKGTMDALRQCKKYVKGPTLVLQGDDMYGKEDLEHAVGRSKKQPTHWFALVKESSGEEECAKVLIDKDARIHDIIEFHQQVTSASLCVLNSGAYVLDERIFQYKPVKIENGEYGLPQTMMQAGQDIVIKAVHASLWMPINTKEDYERAKRIFAKSFSLKSLRKLKSGSE